MVLEKTLESPLDCKEIQSVRSEGDQPWDFFERNDAKTQGFLASGGEEFNLWTGARLDLSKLCVIKFY